MRRILYALLLPVLFGFSQNTFAQENKKEQIAKYLSDYFFLERENIHVQLNKSIYMANEQVWFKGYVFHRRKNIPFFSTINVYASLIDPDGKILETQLVYGNIGSFSGNFTLGDTMKSGKYYLQFYTNWMNNFTEDESSVYEITVVNETTGAGNALAKADPSKISIQLKPEGGTLVSGITNTIGISVADSNLNPLPVSVAEIVDNSGKALLKVQLNKKGYGKFELPAGAVGCKAIVTVGETRHEQLLPEPKSNGIALEINNYASQDKAIVKIKTNKATADTFAGKPFFLLVHQDEKAMLYDVAFKDGSNEMAMAILSKDLFDGMNTIRVLDKDLNQLAERLIYKHQQANLTTELKKTGQASDTLHYKGKVNYSYMNLSISVLPENTMSLDETNDIYSSFLLLPYIKTHRKASGKYYFSTISKVKMYELDLYLMNQESKYEWKNIVSNPPKHNFPFDMGLTLKGTLPKNAEAKFSKVRLYSLMSGIDELADVDDKREFYYNNIVIADSTYINFTLVRKGEKPKEIVTAPQITNAGRKYNKPYKPQPYNYATPAEGAAALPETPRTFREDIQLEEVKIQGTRLKYAKSFGNANLRAYKISDMQANMYQNLLNFIMTYGGFNVNDSQGNVTITSRTINSINGAQSGPIIYIDNIQQLDYSILRNIQMEEVEEIYMSPHAIVPSVRNYQGIIRIYLKKGAKPNTKNPTTDIVVAKGFKKVQPFENVMYSATNNKGFENFGVITWEPTIMTDENGEFNIDIPQAGQQNVKVVIEGFSADGKLVSEIKTLPLK